MDAWALVKRPSFISDKSLVGRRPTHLILRLTILAAATLAILSCKPDNLINVTPTPEAGDSPSEGDSPASGVVIINMQDLNIFGVIHGSDSAFSQWATNVPVEVALEYSANEGVDWTALATIPAGTTYFDIIPDDHSLPDGYYSFRLLYDSVALPLGSFGVDDTPPTFTSTGDSVITGFDNAGSIPFQIATATDNLAAYSSITLNIVNSPSSGFVDCDIMYTSNGSDSNCTYYPDPSGTYSTLFEYQYYDWAYNMTATKTITINISAGPP
ncbi:MAG: hypothetical protein IT288_13875 [Bdellovibrionales bacterium]|nr:hypothetical protein [Bdellovibrionales bacterium]